MVVLNDGGYCKSCGEHKSILYICKHCGIVCCKTCGVEIMGLTFCKDCDAKELSEYYCNLERCFN